MGKKKHKKSEIAVKSNSWSIHAIVLLVLSSGILVYQRIMQVLYTQLATFEPKTLFFWDPDTCYHVRRILYIAQHNMKFTFFDPLLAYPEGAVPVWSPLYDWLLALPSFIISFGHPSERLALISADILNLVFAFGQFFFIGLLVYKVCKSSAVAILSALLVGITGPEVRSANFGILDHDSLVLLIFAAALYCKHILANKDKPGTVARDILPSAICNALFFWTWPGSYLYLAVIAASDLFMIILNRKTWLFKRLAMIYSVSAVMVMPLAWIHYLFSRELFRFEYVSFLAVFFLLATGLFFYLLNIITGLRTRYSAKSIINLILCILFLAVILYFMFVPFKSGAEYAAAQNKWLSIIKESESLLYQREGTIDRFTTAKVTDGFGYLAWFFPVAFLIVAIRKIKISLELYSILIVSSIFFLSLSLFQMKYAMPFCVPFGIIIALFIHYLYNRVTRQFSISWAILFGAILIILLIPLESLFATYESYELYASYQGYLWLKSDASLTDMQINTYPVKDTSKALPVSVMAPWDQGHYLHHYAEMPTVADNFGYIYTSPSSWNGLSDMAAFFLTSDEDKAVNIMKKYKSTYVVVPKLFGIFQYPDLLGENSNEYFEYQYIIENGARKVLRSAKNTMLNSMAMRLNEFYGSANMTQNKNGPKFKALKHFRLVYESPSIVIGTHEVPAGALKIYKMVKGAVLPVPGNGDDYYKLEGLIVKKTGMNFNYRQNGYLREGVVVPYPTEKTDGYAYAQYYKVEVSGQFYEFNTVRAMDLQ